MESVHPPPFPSGAPSRTATDAWCGYALMQEIPESVPSFNPSQGTFFTVRNSSCRKTLPGRHPLWPDTSPRDTPRQTPLWPDPPPSQTHTPRADTPPKMATKADVTHPSGMHSCLLKLFVPPYHPEGTSKNSDNCDFLKVSDIVKSIVVNGEKYFLNDTAMFREDPMEICI